MGKPYTELSKAWDEWIKPVKNSDWGQSGHLEDFFTDYRYSSAKFKIDDNGLVQPIEQASRCMKCSDILPT